MKCHTFEVFVLERAGEANNDVEFFVVFLVILSILPGVVRVVPRRMELPGVRGVIVSPSC